MILPIFAIACCTTKPPRNIGEVTHEALNALAGPFVPLVARHPLSPNFTLLRKAGEGDNL